MRMIKKVKIVYVSGQPNTNTNTKTNGQRNIFRWKLTEWMGDHERWMVAMLRSTALCYQSTQTCASLPSAECQLQRCQSI